MAASPSPALRVIAERRPSRPGGKGGARKRPPSSGSGKRSDTTPRKASAASSRKKPVSGTPRKPAAKRGSRTARLRRPEEIWGRKFAAVGAVLVAAALIGGAVLLATGDDDGDGSSADSVGASSDGLGETLRRPREGMSVSYPEDWRHIRRPAGDLLASADRCTVISLSAPVAADRAEGLLRESLRVLERSFAKGEARATEPSRLGGVPTREALVAVRNRRGDPVVIRVAVSRGPKLAHITQVVLRAPPCEENADDTAAILSSVEFSR